MKKNHAERSLSLRLGWSIPAVLFLFNPNINIVDILPDFIGYGLLCLAFSKVGELNETVCEALAGFRKMMWIDLCKWPAIAWVFGLSVTTERNSSLLLWSFVFGVLEVVFAVPAFVKLFDGLTQIGYRYPNRSLFGDSSEKRKKSRTDRVRNFTVALVVFKALFSVLPEFADLSNSSYDETSQYFNVYRYIGVMRFLSFAAVLVVGAVWLVFVLRYFGSLRRDELLCTSLRTGYERDVLPREGMFIRRNFHCVVGMTLLSLFLTMDLRLERINVIPDFLAALALTATVFLVGKYTDRRKRLDFSACGLYLLFSIFEAAAEYSFFAEYTYSAVIRNESAAFFYGVLTVATVLKNSAFVFCILVLSRKLKRTVILHTGYVAERERNGVGEEKMIQSLWQELNRSLTVAVIFTVIYAAFDCCYPFLAVNYGFAWTLHCAVALTAVGFFGKSLFAVRNAVDTKYMLS